MATSGTALRFGAAFLLGVGVILISANCSFDLRTPTAFWIDCNAEVWECTKTSTPPSFTLSGTNPNISKYIQRKNFWKIKGAAYQAYWDTGIFAFDSGPDVLPGATMVMTGSTDWSDASASFLTVTLGEDVAGVYVAYDSRAQPKPSWLSDQTKYEALSKPMTISLVDNSTTPPGYVALNIYRAKSVTKSGETLVLPGNNYGGPGWQKITQGNPAMYLVFVKPEATVPTDCGSGSGTYKTTDHWDDCYPCDPWSPEEKSKALTTARTAAAVKCKKDHPNDVCLTPVCSQGAWTPECPDNDNSVTGCVSCRLITEGFQHNSEAVFLPATSSASGTVAGSGFTSAISGTLLFEYHGDSLVAMNTMRLNRMTLDLASFGTEIGEFTEVKVSLVTRTDAECQDSPAPAVTPCAWYQIPVDHFACAESCRIDGDPTAISSDNDQPIDIHVDTVAHTFTFSGSLQGIATVNGEDHEIDITLNLHGQVVNYAPSAVAEFEGDDSAECSDETNASAIYLHAGDSFDVEDGALPSSSFLWYEDMGLVTQTAWGQGPTLTIDAGQLGFGLHNFTLVVTDSQGILATDTIVVPVVDTTPPELQVPDDVEVFTATPLPIQLAIGEAHASDACLPLGGDAISNDAPADMRFDAGVTVVTWSADDGRGNIATGEQRVVVNSVGGFDSLLDAIRQGIVQLQEAVDQSRADISQCEPAAECSVDLGDLVASIDELIETTNAAAGDVEPDANPYGGLLTTLESARTHILEAASLLDESNVVGEADPASMLREQAIDNLVAARTMLDEAAQQVETLEDELGPTDGDGASDDDSLVPDDGESADDGVPPGGTRRTGWCGLGVILLLTCVPVLAIWKASRRLS